MSNWAVIQGDCLETMKKIPENSVDSVVTDPPYGLAKPPPIEEVLSCWLRGEPWVGELKKGASNCAHSVVKRAGAFNPERFDSDGSQGFVPLKVSLSTSAPGVLGSVNLDGKGLSWEVEVDDNGSPLDAENLLVNKGHAEIVKTLTDGEFFLREIKGKAPCVSSCTCLAKASHPLPSVLVRLRDNTLRGSCGAPSVVASGGAEITAMLTFDVARGSFVFTPASAALQGHATLELVPSGDIGALSGAVDTAAVLQSHGIRKIGDSATGTDSFDLLVHDSFLKRFFCPSIAQFGFMGKEWDSSVPGPEYWRECYRVLKPGGHMCVFAGSRTVDLMGMALRLAGFEIRDSLQYLYGQGFPKSMNAAEAIRTADRGGNRKQGPVQEIPGKVSEKYEGWGTALKPAHEPILLVRKPFKGTVAKNVQEHGTGGLNIDGCRVEGNEVITQHGRKETHSGSMAGKNYAQDSGTNPHTGRWPANVIMDEDAGAILDAQSGNRPGMSGGGKHKVRKQTIAGGGHDGNESHIRSDSGGASRFFYCAKTSKKERNAGLGTTKTVTKTRIVWLPEPPSVVVRKCDKCGETFEAWREDELCDICDPLAFEASRFREETYTESVEVFGTGQTVGGGGTGNPVSGAYGSEKAPAKNFHPTVKPISLMRWLCRLITPPGGLILDPFTGSGSTGCAASIEGFNFIGCELSDEYCEIAQARIEHHEKS